ncbi:MAG: CDP-alcohol phosphatidyltransferase family protein [Bacteroidota bacterium]
MKGKAFIPNAFTLGNLVCGVIAICYITEGPELAVIFVLIGAIFDFFDGFVARALKVQSEIGKQLDSLADMVTFGVVPALMALRLVSDIDESWDNEFLIGEQGVLNLAIVSNGLVLCLAAAACYRLAKFNVATDQTTDFKGLPTPANALFWTGLTGFFYFQYVPKTFLERTGLILSDPRYFFILLALIFSLLMISNIPIFGLKFKNLSIRDNVWKYLLLTSALILLVFLKWLALPIIVVLYIVLSLIKNWSS